MMSENNLYRYERKFAIRKNLINSKVDLERYIGKRLIYKYSSRQINSIYYDTYDLKLAKKNLEGISKKEKIRIRFYGIPNKMINPKLEIKSKWGNIGKKDFISLDNLDLNKHKFSLSMISKKNLINNHYLDTLLRIVKPIVFLTYQRQYYQSECLNFRFTLDKNICFKILNQNISSLNFENNLINSFHKEILELKYGCINDINARTFSRRLPFKLVSFSKYIMSLNHLGFIK